MIVGGLKLKSKLIFIAIILFLAGCTSSKEVDELKLSYEASLNKMESSKESELYDLKLKLMHLTSNTKNLKRLRFIVQWEKW